MEGDFFDVLKKKMDQCAHLIYASTRKFPKEELYYELRNSNFGVIARR